AAAALGARRPELRLGGPRIGVAVTAVERVDVLEDHVSGVGHLVSDVVVGSAILSAAPVSGDCETRLSWSVWGRCQPGCRRAACDSSGDWPRCACLSNEELSARARRRRSGARCWLDQEL